MWEGIRTKKGLTRHSRVYTGENNFVCDLCGKDSGQKGFKRHSREILEKNASSVIDMERRKKYLK